MRVAIVSQFAHDNFGNKLQNVALQQSLLHYAENVVTIKTRSDPKTFVQYIREYSFAADSIWIRKILRKHRTAKFMEFHRRCISQSYANYNVKKEYGSLKKQDRCDLYCAGSDQVWKPGSGRTGMFNYLGFADYDRTFSYAASFGVDRIPEEHKDAVRKGLNHIKFISVREDAGKRIVEELTGRMDVQVLVDPTMLLTTQEWDAIAIPPPKPLPEKYVLTYFLGEVPPQRRSDIQRKARELGCELIELMDKKSPFYAIGPDHFVYLIKHAALVCTDSFHGSVFSFLYQRPLAIFDRKGNGEDMSSRLVTLATKFHLEDCMAKDDCLPEVPEEADYSAGYAALEVERRKSKAFLDMVFEEAERAGLCD